MKTETSSHIMKSHFKAQIVDGWMDGCVKEERIGEEEEGRQENRLQKKNTRGFKRKKERNKRKEARATD